MNTRIPFGCWRVAAAVLAGFLSSSQGLVAAEAGAPPGPNLAIVATPSSAFTSGDTTVWALNDGAVPRNSRDNRQGSYGNWPRVAGHWVQYDWAQPISTKETEVYWWDDRRGVRLPKACRLKYWDGQAFVPVAGVEGLGVAGDQFNRTTFEEVTTTKLRLEMDSDAEFSTGVLEWRVYDSGKSPAFPPRASAGIDRSVMANGKTYLSGTVKSLKAGPHATRIEWSKVSGPGEVAFENANALETTATFSKAGSYTLKLAAAEDALRSESTLTATVVAPPPAERLDVVYTTPYRIDSPLWKARARALIVNWIPHCIEYINRTNLTEGQGGIDNFIEAAKALRGEPHGPHKGYVFANAWVHQTIESICIALMVDAGGDPEILKAQEQLRSAMEDWIPKILAAQEPDGYLQTAYTLADRGRWPERWSPRNRGDHEGYVAGYFIESAINHYTLTHGKDRRLYDAAKKLADCWVANLGPGKRDWYDGHQEMEQALVRFGRFVNDMEGAGHGDAYVRLAKFLLDCRRDGSEYDQSHVPVQRQYEAVGHAVRATYSYSAMADVAAETGDVDYQSAVMSLWDNMVNRKYYLTGGIGSGETSEGFGPDFSLRNTAYCESCSSCGLIFFQYKMNLAYHDARYADLYEETLYNALLGSIDLPGKNFYYDNPLVGGEPRYPWHVCPCCVGNIPRTLLMIPTWTYVKGRDGLYVNLFIGGKIDAGKVAGTNVEMVQETDYPWKGQVAITVNPEKPAEFTIYVRAPNRATSRLYTASPGVRGLEKLRVNAKPVEAEAVNGYVPVRRRWTRGDRIELELPMVPQRVKADERIAADRGRVALRFGPLVYNVEQADQPDVNRRIGTEPLQAVWREDLLGGVLTLEGKWADGSRLVAIPNYSRNNRTGPAGSEAGSRRKGGGQSMVWIKDE